MPQSSALLQLPVRTLVWLALATFAVGMDGFVITGLLPRIATDTGVSASAAGQLITVFALTFAVAAPLLGALTGHWPRRRVLLAAFVVFVVGNVATASVDGYGALLVTRAVAALGAAQITSSSAAIATALVAPEQRGRALGFVMGGLISASAVGVPLGLLLGLVSWRATMLLVAGIGVVAAVGIATRLPDVALPALGLRARLAPLGRREVVMTASVTTLYLTAAFSVVGYLTFTLQSVGASALTVILALTGYGIAAVITNIVAGHRVDSAGPARVTRAVLLSSIVVFALGGLATAPAVGVPTTFVWAVLLGLCGGAITVPQQATLVALDPPSAPALLGLNSSSIYAGQAAGAALGGAVLQVAPIAVLGPFAAGVAAVAFGVHRTTMRRTVGS